MLRRPHLSLAFALYLGCTTEDVDSGDYRPSAPTGGRSGNVDRSTWVPRENPVLGPDSGPYAFRNVVILGGGFVTGLEFSRVEPDLIYARTDVGGVYRWDAPSDRWLPLTDWLSRAESNLMGIESIAPDPVDADRVYVAAGTYIDAGDGKILRSTDRGATWEVHAIPVPMGGNAAGRSMGERLAVDPSLPSALLFASRTAGLWKSADSGATWARVASFPAVGEPNLGLSFVLFDPRTGGEQGSTTLYVGVATTTESSLYRSSDGGASWEAVPNQPVGLMPHHAALDDDGILYLAYNDAPGPNDITGGAVYKLDTADGTWTEITPRPIEAGYGGLSIDRSRPGTLMVTTIDLWPDLVFRSSDGGATWVELSGKAAFDLAGAEYLRWHGSRPSATGWMGDVEIDPFYRNRALYVTGQGVWWSDDVDAADAGAGTHWLFRNHGLEETVPLALVSPPSGAHLLSGLGDVSGFKHDDLDAPSPTGMFDSPIFGNTTSLDFAEAAPEIVARVGTAGSGTSQGAYSTDGGTSWQAFRTEPPGQPASNGGQGSVAVSADGSTIVWAPRRTPAAYTRDRGVTWTPCTGLPAPPRAVASDRKNPNLFYALSSGQVFVSHDGGASFGAAANPAPPGATALRPVFDREGELWIPTPSGAFRSSDAGQTFAHVESTRAAHAVGFGMAAPGAEYPAVYLVGNAGDQSGVFRSDDGGTSWQRIDDDEHEFGWIAHVTGDPRIYGRVYLGTGGRGILYGDPR